MATKSTYSNMLNQKPVAKGVLKEEKPTSPWSKMFQKGKK